MNGSDGLGAEWVEGCVGDPVIVWGDGLGVELWTECVEGHHRVDSVACAGRHRQIEIRM